MLAVIAYVIAQMLFWMMTLRRTWPKLLGVSLAATAGATLLFFSPQASYIAANGSTATTWQSGGAAGTGAFQGSSLDTAGATTLSLGGVNASALSLSRTGQTTTSLGPLALAANAGLSGAAGTGAVTLGSLTGDMSCPTGNLSWSGAATKTLALTAAGSSNVSTSTGTLTLDGPTVSVGPTTASTVNLGNNASDPKVIIGDVTPGSTQAVQWGPPFGPGTKFSINAGTAVAASLAVNSADFIINESNADLLTLGVVVASAHSTALLPNELRLNAGDSTNGLLDLPACGTGAASPGQLTIAGEDANANCTPSAAGNLRLRGGNVLAGGSGNGGQVSITSGTPSAGNGSGNINLNVGTATASQGQIAFNLNGSALVSMGLAGFQPHIGGTLACGTGATVTVAANSFAFPVTTGTLTSNCVIDFGTNATKGFYLVDLSGATPGATFGIQFKNGTATRTYLSTGVIAGTLGIVMTSGANTLAVNF